MSRMIALVLCLAGLLFAAGVYAADSGVQIDPSMGLRIGPAVAAPVAIPPSVPAEVPIQEIVALALTLFAFSLRRFSPGVPWLHTPGALVVVSLATMLLTALAGAIAAQGISVRVVLLAITSAMTAALAQSNPSLGGATPDAAVPSPFVLPPPDPKKVA